MLKKHFDSSVPIQLEEDQIDKNLLKKIELELSRISSSMSQRKFRAAMTHLRMLWGVGNEYITEKEPWHVLKKNEESGAVILVHCVHLMRIFSIASNPFLPDTARSICDILNDDFGNYPPISDAASFSYFKAKHRLKDADLLFAKIESDETNMLSTLYSGNRGHMGA
jgi:methionyl-tRNA synthetase